MAIDITSDLIRAWLDLAISEAEAGAAEGGEPIGSVLIGPEGEVLGRGRNRFAQTGLVTTHAEKEAFDDADFRTSYAGTTMVTTMEPCWFCSGLIRQWGISRVVIGNASGRGGAGWLEELGFEVHRIDDPASHALVG